MAKKHTKHSKPSKLTTSRILLVLLVVAILLSFVSVRFMSNQTEKQEPLPSYTSTNPETQEFDLKLRNGKLVENADFELHAKQGQLVSFNIGSDTSGVMTFSNGSNIIQRPVALTPLNQFYFPSDKAGRYKVVFEVGADLADPKIQSKASYFMGTLVIDSVTARKN